MYHWRNPETVQGRSYTCGHCETKVSPNQGYVTAQGTSDKGRLFICPGCGKPTFFDMYNSQFPEIVGGNPVDKLDDKNLKGLYEEARACTSLRAFTGTVMLCRKILMNLAVKHKAAENLKFVQYVDYLASNGWVPPNGKTWVTKIKDKGNEANHEIHLMSEEDAREILRFTEMLLKFNFEFDLDGPG